VLAAWAVPQPAPAQDPADLVQQGIRAYRDLEYAAATDLLLGALTAAAEGGLADADRIRALGHLGAIEALQGRVDSAAVFFRRLLLFDPRYRIERLVFPPEVTDVFELVRGRTHVVAIEIPDEAEIALGTERLSARLFASSPHAVTADIRLGGGGVVARLYAGPIGDSLEILWDPRDAAGQPIASGTYFLTLTSRDVTRRVSRRIQVPLDVEVHVRDTLLHPSEPSRYLPEQEPSRPRGEALAGGLLVGGALLLLPAALAPEAELMEGRIVVAGAVTLAGVIGFFKPAPGPAIPENVAANQRHRQDWLDSVRSSSPCSSRCVRRLRKAAHGSL
jgi:hypothetical protein